MVRWRALRLFFLVGAFFWAGRAEAEESALPVVGIFTQEAPVREGLDLTFSVFRQYSASNALRVRLEFSGDLKAGEDFLVGTNDQVTIPKGQNSVVVRLPVLADPLTEDTETAIVGIAEALEYRVSSLSNVVISVLDGPKRGLAGEPEISFVSLEREFVWQENFPLRFQVSTNSAPLEVVEVYHGANLVGRTRVWQSVPVAVVWTNPPLGDVCFRAVVRDKAGYSSSVEIPITILAEELTLPSTSGAVWSTKDGFVLSGDPSFFISHYGESNQSRAVAEFPIENLKDGGRFLKLGITQQYMHSLLLSNTARVVLFEGDGIIGTNDYDAPGVEITRFRLTDERLKVRWIDLTETLRTNSFSRLGVRVEPGPVPYALNLNVGGYVEASLARSPAGTRFNEGPMLRAESFPKEVTAPAGVPLEIAVEAGDPDDGVQSVVLTSAMEQGTARAFVSPNTSVGAGTNRFTFVLEPNVGRQNLTVTATDSCGEMASLSLGTLVGLLPAEPRFYTPKNAEGGAIRVAGLKDLNWLEESRDLKTWGPVTNWLPWMRRVSWDPETQSAEIAGGGLRRFYRVRKE